MKTPVCGADASKRVMKRRYIKPHKFPLWAKANNSGNSESRYHLFENGIRTEFDGSANLPYKNHIEMSGFKTSSIISYRIDKNRRPRFYRFCVFPSLRILPNDTRGSLVYAFPGVSIEANGKKEKIENVFFNGILEFNSVAGDTKIKRRFVSGNDRLTLVEEIKIKSSQTSCISFKCKKTEKVVNGSCTASGKSYTLSTVLYSNGKAFSPKNMSITVIGEATFYIAYCAEKLSEADVKRQIKLRENFIESSRSRLAVNTPDENINQMIEFTKIRASESIFETKNGLMHAPGGGQYYAALWTNDQCEYANPLFAYLGYDKAWEQSVNCYSLYSGLAKPDKAIYTSIVAEGDDYWYGAGDRGDSSMYIYGFARYLLTTGDKETAQKYQSALEAACEYVMSKMNTDNVIESDSDELENRFESGNANLSTAVISYDAFRSMSYLEKELGRDDMSNLYYDFSEKIENGIYTYFEANVEGYDTYRYCKEENNLRSWICLPMTVGIFNRVEGTLAALKSDRLKKPTGLLTKSGTATYWDRSLLYALRGLFYAGKADDALEMLNEYTSTRLLGEHVPYPIEAYPEGNAAHLSAESALYIRIFTEGVMGFRPLGFDRFELKPNLPSEWNEISAKDFYYAKKPITIEIKKNGDEIWVKIPELNYCKSAKSGECFTINIK